MGAALRLGDGVDLVDDHRLDAGEDLARLRGHHQVQRLRRRDQDVRRLAEHRLALVLRRVAGPQADREVGADPRPAALAGCARRRRRAPSAARRRPKRRPRAVPVGVDARSAASGEVSIPQRNAVSVLPEPVGAQISVFAPVAIAGQPCSWAGVGASNERSNQARVRSLNPASGSVFSVFFVTVANRSILGIGRLRLTARARLPGEERVRRVDRHGLGGSRHEADVRRDRRGGHHRSRRRRLRSPRGGRRTAPERRRPDERRPDPRGDAVHAGDGAPDRRRRRGVSERRSRTGRSAAHRGRPT